MSTIDRPYTAEILSASGSPGELDNIRLTVLVRYGTTSQKYANIKPLNYVRQLHTCVAPTPGKDTCWIVWRGDNPAFVAPIYPEYETCTGAGGQSPLEKAIETLKTVKSDSSTGGSPLSAPAPSES